MDVLTIVLLSTWLFHFPQLDTLCLTAPLQPDMTLLEERCSSDYFPLQQDDGFYGQSGILESDLTLPLKPRRSFFICQAIDGQASCMRHDQAIFLSTPTQKELTIHSLRGSAVNLTINGSLLKFHAYNSDETWMKKFFLNGVWGVVIIDNHRQSPVPKRDVFI